MNKAMHVFCYGSLMFDPVWRAVVQGDYQSEPAVLRGYGRYAIKDETFPALVPGKGDDLVEGRLYFDVTGTDLKRLDRFEGDYYQREMVTLRRQNGELVEAAVYLFEAQYHHLLEPRPWDVAWFEREGLALFLKNYRGFLE